MIDRLTIGLLNAAGVLRSPDKIIKTCKQNNIDFIILTETFLERGRLTTDWLQHHNYAQPAVDGHGRPRGGISLLVRPDLPHHVHPYEITTTNI